MIAKYKKHGGEQIEVMNDKVVYSEAEFFLKNG